MSRTISLSTLEEWDRRHAELMAGGMAEPFYGGPLGRHVTAGDYRLRKLKYDPSPAALRLWNFLLTEEERLHRARGQGKKIVGTMKDLGTVPVMVYSLRNAVAFYPDGAWWTPCIMENSDKLLTTADGLGVNESFCPVRAMLGAFVCGDRFPIPDLLTCSVGAVCDDFSAVAQRLEGLGYPIFWWEIPHRRRPEPDEPALVLPGGFTAAAEQVAFVKAEMVRILGALKSLTGESLGSEELAAGIRKINGFRRLLAELRQRVFTAERAPLPGLEMLVAEMLAIHFCSDQDEAMAVIAELLAEVRRRMEQGLGIAPAGAARVFWVNPLADLRIMNLLEECGGRICGTEYLFCHALDEIPEDIEPLEALARMALADPMVGPSADRAERICRDIRRFGAEAVVISRIPGASHCAIEGTIIGDKIRKELGLPVLEMEVPVVADALLPTLRTRLEALIETALGRRKDRA